ncbi:ttc30a [Symbiodinium sp. KB8]|nr:ttc30a [Symbiodinium sp. KB8]
MGGIAGRAGIPEGKATATIYGLIREQKYADAVGLLNVELQNFPRSRAALSLLGYCYYYLQDFRAATQTYEQLVQFHPEVEEYKIYYAQSLYKAGIYADASKVAMSVDGAEHSQRMSMLQAAIKYEEDDVSACESLLSEGDATDADSLIGTACIRFKEGKTDEARAKFEEAAGILGWQASVAYGIALCHYQAGEYRRALELVGDIIERGVREHPELSVGSNTGGLDVSPARATAPARPLAMTLAIPRAPAAPVDTVPGPQTRSVGNTQILRETALVEAFNLRAAIEFKFGNQSSAAEALSDMPPR